MSKPVPATTSDAAEIWQLRRQREDWLAAQEIDQWVPGEVPSATIQDQIEKGEWHLVREDGVIAALRLLWEDPEFWGFDDGTAVYVHGLMVELSHAGKGLGAELLYWAARTGQQRGRSHLRLDSALTNPELARYYQRLGFTRVGQRQVGNLFEVILWEHPLSPTLMEVGEENPYPRSMR